MNQEIEHRSEEAFVVPKKKFIVFTRQTIYLSLLGCLLIPVIFICYYGICMGAKGITWVALLSATFAAGCGLALLSLWEKKMQRSVAQLVHAKIEKFPESDPSIAQGIEAYEQEIKRLTLELDKTKIGYEHQINLMQSSVAKSKDEVHQLHLEMDKKLEEMRLAYHEFEDLRREYHRLEEEGAHFQQEAQNNLNHKDALLSDYQRTISEQRVIIEKKQRYIAKLEGKIRDLMYEIRSLLQLEASSGEEEKGKEHFMNDALIDTFSLASSSALNTPYDFSVQLKKYIEIAENLTGIEHLGYMGGKAPRFLDLSSECYAIDRRRLFDCFKDEMGAIIFVYSSVEKQFLFVNQVVKTTMGWNPEKFMKEFARLVCRGYSEWQEALSKIKNGKECVASLTILNKMGQSKQFDCYMGIITKGPFAHHIIGILGNKT